MKPLVCELCGGNELIKQDGFFVCPHCGTKYTPEEAKRLIIEGPVDVSGSTVKVDNSALVERYLANARRAKQKEDWDETERYYNLVEQNDPSNIEAIFYSAYGKAKTALVDSDLYKRQAAFKVLQNCISILDDNFEIAKEAELKEIIQQISNDITLMSYSSFVYTKKKNGYGITVSSDKAETIKLFNALAIEFTTTLDNIAKRIPDSEKKKRAFYYGLAITHCENFLRNAGMTISIPMRNNILDVINSYHEKIRQIDPSHKIPDDTKSIGLPKTATSSGWGTYMTIGMILFCIFPVSGAMISGIALYNAKKGTATNINTNVAKATLFINIPFSIAGIIWLISHLIYI